MIQKNFLAISAAAASFALLTAFPAWAAPAQEQMSTPQPAGEQQAVQMVPARVALLHDLDSRKAQPGAQFETKLAGKVQLKNGPLLPSGTALIGTVAKDDTQGSGSKLVLRFTEAKLKDGMTVPIKATIVGIFPPESTNGEGYDIVAGDQAANTWSPNMLGVDQIGALSGVDLHSKIASNNSGVLVAPKKSSVKLSVGSEFTLAIAAQGNAQPSMSGTTGGF